MIRLPTRSPNSGAEVRKIEETVFSLERKKRQSKPAPELRIVLHNFSVFEGVLLRLGFCFGLQNSKFSSFSTFVSIIFRFFAMPNAQNALGRHNGKDVELTFYLRPLELRKLNSLARYYNVRRPLFRLYIIMKYNRSVGIGIVYPREIGNAKA